MALRPKDLKGHIPVIYIRYSSREQAKGDAKKPIEKRSVVVNQLAAIKRWIKESGL